MQLQLNLQKKLIGISLATRWDDKTYRNIIRNAKEHGTFLSSINHNKHNDIFNRLMPMQRKFLLFLQMIY